MTHNTLSIRAILILLIFQALHVNAAHAQSQGAQIGEVTYSGSGCPNESVGVVLSPDRLTVSLLFDAFVAETSGNSDGNRGRPLPVKKDCILKIPLIVPAGVQARLSAVDLRGYVGLPARALGHLRGRVNLEVGGRPHGRVIGGLEHRMLGPKDQSYLINQLPDARADQSWTPCGRSVDVRVLSQATVVASPGMSSSDTAIVTVDSVDVAAEDTTVKIGLEWRNCR